MPDNSFWTESGHFMKALVVEDTQTSMSLICRSLESMGITPLKAADGETALRLFKSERPDIVLLDIILPGIDGFEVARRIRSGEKNGEWTPIIMLTARNADADVERGIEAGGDDYVVKPFSEVVLGAKVRAMQRIVGMRESLLVLARELDTANRELKRLSSVDGLTGVGNRRHFDEMLAREWRRAVRAEKPLSLLLCDVDYFKPYNDCYGHQQGDESLRLIANAVETQLKRPGDTLARYGGEEFAAILPETNSEGAMRVAESIQQAVSLLAIPHETSEIAQRVTVSVGVACIKPRRSDDARILVAAADAALYEAKGAGRNCVRLGGDAVVD